MSTSLSFAIPNQQMHSLARIASSNQQFLACIGVIGAIVAIEQAIKCAPYLQATIVENRLQKTLERYAIQDVVQCPVEDPLQKRDDLDNVGDRVSDVLIGTMASLSALTVIGLIVFTVLEKHYVVTGILAVVLAIVFALIGYVYNVPKCLWKQAAIILPSPGEGNEETGAVRTDVSIAVSQI